MNSTIESIQDYMAKNQILNMQEISSFIFLFFEKKNNVAGIASIKDVQCPYATGKSSNHWIVSTNLPPQIFNIKKFTPQPENISTTMDKHNIWGTALHGT